MDLSVVVPVYNGERYLRECLDSLTEQGLNESSYEIIIVNDGSTDNTESIIDEYCDKYAYIHKINKTNGGVSSARNAGIQAVAGGGYVCFVDADDKVSAYVLSPIVKAMKQHSLDAFYFEITSKYPLDALIDEEAFNCVISEQRGRQCAPLFLSKEFIKIHQLKYEVGRKYGEDQLFNFFVTVNTKKVGYVSKKIYYYRCDQNEDSAVHTLFKTNKVARSGSREHQYYTDSMFNASKYKEYQLQKHGKLIAYTETMLSNALMMTMWAGMRCFYSGGRVIQDLKAKNLSPKDITRKTIEGHSLKMRIKSEIQFLFRYPIIYRTFSFLFKIICRVKSVFV